MMFLYQVKWKTYIASMETRILNRFSSLQFNNGKKMRNRIVVPPMASETADLAGFVTEKTIAHYQRLCESGAGLVMVEYTYVHPTGKSEENQLGIQSDDHLEGLSKIAKIIHDSGAMAGLQVTHAGGKTLREFTGGALMGPSSVAVPVKDRNMESPEPMSLEQISIWKSSFVSAATRAVRAGFDLLEFHAAHGYGLNQWLSPITNRRSDKYGGSARNNSRLLLEVILQVQKTEPGILLAVRMPGQDFFEGGLAVTDAVELAITLEKMGIDLIDVSSGIGGWKRPRDRAGEGYLVSEAGLIQATVKVPVIGVGGIEHGSFIDECIRQGNLSLAAVGRAILRDPQAWKESQLCPCC
jgi:NADPH2 dehydrogenase